MLEDEKCILVDWIKLRILKDSGKRILTVSQMQTLKCGRTSFPIEKQSSPVFRVLATTELSNTPPSHMLKFYDLRASNTQITQELGLGCLPNSLFCYGESNGKL